MALGAPARNILRLSRYGVSVLYQQNGTMEGLEREIRKGSVVIAFVRTGDLPYWDEDVPHAVVISGIEAGVLYLHDPSFQEAPIPVTEDDFILAWDEFGGHWAAVTGPPRESP
ncbi:MAG: peptidase C39 family protein [Anaerolineae bacterium]|nr:peptidase C39 family protein [Anaerolineae bacterium]